MPPDGDRTRADTRREARRARWSGTPARLLLALGLTALTLAAFAGVAELDFVALDDPGYVSANPTVLQGLTAEGVRYAFTSTSLGNWHPLTWLSHMGVAQLAGNNPGAHHVANLVLHWISVLLLYALLVRTTGAFLPSALAAGLFAVHPLRVESVAWVSERKDVLSITFWMLALHAWVGWVRTREWRWYLLTAAAFLAGLMSKPMLVTLPFTLLLLDVWPLGRWRARAATDGTSLGRLVLEKLPLLGLSVVWCGVTVYAQHVEGGMRFGETVAFGTRAANAMRTVGVYLLQTVWPTQLAVWYPYLDPIPLVQVALSAAVVVAVSVAALAAFRRAPYLLVGWLWYLGTLIPVLGLVQVGNQAHHDHYTYVPHVGLLTSVAFGVAALARGSARRRLVAGGLVGVALGACTLATAAMVKVWRDDKALFEHALQMTKGSTLGHDHMAHHLQVEGRIDEAILHYREVVRILPDLATGHVNLGMALHQRGDLDDALASYRLAIELDPSLANAWSNIGVILGLRGNHTEAADMFTRALELQPDKPGLLLNSALNDLSRAEVAAATRSFRRAAELDESTLQTPAALQFAWILSTHPDAVNRDGQLARRIAEDRLRAGGASDPVALEVLAAAQAECGSFEEAVASVDAALALALEAGAADAIVRLEQARALYASRQALRSG